MYATKWQTSRETDGRTQTYANVMWIFFHYSPASRKLALSGNSKESFNPILDLDADPDYHRNIIITSELSEIWPFQKISAKSAGKFVSNLLLLTNQETNKRRISHNLRGGKGNTTSINDGNAASSQYKTYIPGSAVRMWNEDADIDAKDGADDAEESDWWKLADELHADEHAEKHERQQRGAVDAIVVVSVRWDVDCAEQRCIRHHVLLHVHLHHTT